MDAAFWESLLDWISTHPIAAGVVIFAIAFLDALVIVGVAVPAVPLLIAVGALVGLGHIDGVYALVCASLGCFAGDGISFWLGRRYGSHLRQVWPFRTHPQWLEGGERAFRKNGLKSILIARYIGAIRPFVPAIAGMLGMRVGRYVFASTIVCIVWSASFLLPGWILGTSLDLVSAVAGRLAVVIGLVLALVAAIWGGVFYLWRWLAPRAIRYAESVVRVSLRHPQLGKFVVALVDPNRKESASLLFMACALLAAGWGFFWALISVGAGTEPSDLYITVHQAMFALSNPLADPVMAFWATLGDAWVLWPAVAIVFVWLLWRRRPEAAWHFLAAPVFALLLTQALGWLIDLPKPPAATMVAGFSFPSFNVTMATVVYSFFAVLLAREMPERPRVWPYVVAGLLVGLVGFGRLYLGAHWLSDVLAGIFLGLLWTTILGIAYRSRRVRRQWVLPVSAIFFSAVVALSAWHGYYHTGKTLQNFEPPFGRTPISTLQWQHPELLPGLPQRRNELRGRDAWPLNVHYAGSLEFIRSHLHARGWRIVEPGGWTGLLQMLDKNTTFSSLPIMPAAHHGRAEELIMAQPADDGVRMDVLRLWRAPYELHDSGQIYPVWVGTAQRLKFSQRLQFVSYWSAEEFSSPALMQLFEDSKNMGVSGSPLRVIQIRELRINPPLLADPGISP